MNDEITIRELLDKMHAAVGRMSAKNDHRAIMLHAMSAIMQLSQTQKPVERPMVELAQ